VAFIFFKSVLQTQKQYKLTGIASGYNRLCKM